MLNFMKVTTRIYFFTNNRIDHQIYLLDSWLELFEVVITDVSNNRRPEGSHAKSSLPTRFGSSPIFNRWQKNPQSCQSTQLTIKPKLGICTALNFVAELIAMYSYHLHYIKSSHENR
jgi:hypothetical protein